MSVKGIARKVPVIRLTTDLQGKGRQAFIGSDPTSDRSTAAYLMRQVIGVREERELGFRRVLRSEFPKLSVDERVNSDDDSEFVYRNVVRYIEDHGAPAGVLNVAGGNIGISKAINEFGLAGKSCRLPLTRVRIYTKYSCNSGL